VFKYLKSILNFREQKKQLVHILLLAFLLSFAIARLWSLGVGNGIYIFGYHIHHFYFGMMVLTAGGLLALLTEKKRYRRVAAGLMGWGMGWFADEIGLLLNCTTNNRPCLYAFPDTLDIIGSIALVIVLLLILVDYLEKFYAKKEIKKSRLAHNRAVVREPDMVDPSRSIE
jgi:hypothetical protein